MILGNKIWLESLYRDYDIWKGWSAELPSRQEGRNIEIELSRSGVKPPARVLEIGYGTGTLLLHLQTLGYECWGVERRSDHKANLERSGINVRASRLAELPDAHFDLICAMDVLEHLEKDELLSTVNEIREALKPGGRFIARFPNSASPFGAMNQTADLTHLTQLSISSFSQVCSVTGLRFVNGWNSAVDWRADGLLRSCVKPFLLMARRSFEAVIGAIYYGERRPLDMNVTVCAERPYDL